jgi:hypothetical protein
LVRRGFPSSPGAAKGLPGPEPMPEGDPVETSIGRTRSTPGTAGMMNRSGRRCKPNYSTDENGKRGPNSPMRLFSISRFSTTGNVATPNLDTSRRPSMRDSTHYNNPPDTPQPGIHRTGATPSLHGSGGSSHAHLPQAGDTDITGSTDSRLRNPGQLAFHEIHDDLDHVVPRSCVSVTSRPPRGPRSACAARAARVRPPEPRRRSPARVPAGAQGGPRRRDGPRPARAAGSV